MSDKPISYQPTDGLTYDPEDARYWDRGLLRKEVERVFEVCNGCRMCFKFCDSFPRLFTFLDQEHGGGVERAAGLDPARHAGGAEAARRRDGAFNDLERFAHVAMIKRPACARLPFV